MTPEKTRETTLSIPQLRAVRQEERRKLNQLLKRRRMTERMLLETDTIIVAINEIKDKKELESMIPLGGGILVSGTVNGNTLKRTLPGNIVVPATHEEVARDLSERKKILASDMQQLMHEIQVSGQNLQGMENVLQLLRQRQAEQRKK